MLAWITANIGTILITFALAAIVTAILVRMRRDKKKGKSPCGCDCGHCAMSTSCHSR